MEEIKLIVVCKHSNRAWHGTCKEDHWYANDAILGGTNLTTPVDIKVKDSILGDCPVAFLAGVDLYFDVQSVNEHMDVILSFVTKEGKEVVCDQEELTFTEGMYCDVLTGIRYRVRYIPRSRQLIDDHGVPNVVHDVVYLGTRQGVKISPEAIFSPVSPFARRLAVLRGERDVL